MSTKQNGQGAAATEIVYLTPEDLHERWKRRVAIRTLANWRCLGTGPKYTKIGGRILYPQHEIEVWESRRTTDRTSSYGRAMVAALAILAMRLSPWVEAVAAIS